MVVLVVVVYVVEVMAAGDVGSIDQVEATDVVVDGTGELAYRLLDIAKVLGMAVDEVVGSNVVTAEEVR